ncbi:hypothetical protein Tco_0771272, partial [Tanacetum coccineum]
GIVNNTLRPTIPSDCDSEWRRLMELCWAPDPTLYKGSTATQWKTCLLPENDGNHRMQMTNLRSRIAAKILLHGKHACYMKFQEEDV